MSAFVIGGTHSGVGKTTISLGLMAALTKRSLRVQGFKVGPDFIDPSFHTKACGGIRSRNLDGWMLSQKMNIENFQSHTSLADVSIIEGVMGLFDGAGGKTEDGSTAQIAKWLGVPVILVVDASAMSRSAAAIVKGFTEFDPEVSFAGVIFNRVAGLTHYKWLKEAVESSLDIPVLGGMPRHTEIQVPERHLGLHMPDENESIPDDYWNRLAEIMEDHLDLDSMLKRFNVRTQRSISQHRKVKPSQLKLAVARDEAFCFYYEDNLDYLREKGVKLVEFSPLQGQLPLDVDGIYLGGGYPELYARALSENQVVLDQIRNFALDGGMIYAECGGLIYLSQHLDRGKEDFIPLCGVLPFSTKMTPRCKLGYAEVRVRNAQTESPIEMRGHYFHYSEIVGSYKGTYEFEVTTTDGKKFLEGFNYKNTHASYVHVHFGSNPRFVDHLLGKCHIKSMLRHVSV